LLTLSSLVVLNVGPPATDGVRLMGPLDDCFLLFFLLLFLFALRLPCDGKKQQQKEDINSN
jgi:hypothetical protein